MKKLLFLVVVMGFVLSTIPTAIVYAETEGANLLEERCSVCHPTSRPKSKQKTPEQWETTVNRMMGKGAKLTEEEKVILLDFLSKTYKP
ncbi:MAG: hypothetical protein OET55_06045 [Desulfuromonadales bacterium]|nr:hypothetical protein [Desulfuromonadales bacterium]MDH3960818.1 hypothetical protein [Desulfuromonadales bacterium]